jgi:transposase
MDGSKQQPMTTAGLDLGDKYSYLCLIDSQSGEVMEEGRLRTTPEAFRRRFASEQPPMRIAIEAGTHSPWASRVLEECGHEVLVANARKLRLIYANKRKTDEVDAENLARLAPGSEAALPGGAPGRGLPGPYGLNPLEAGVDRMPHAAGEPRSRAVKSFGHRLPKCPASSFHNKAAEHIPEALLPALGSILETIGSLTGRIREYDRKLETIFKERYPETELLRQVEGVGPLTALTFVLTLEDPYRFEKIRSVGAYLGLVPVRDQSGDRDPQRCISKEGDEMLRRLLVSGAHYILGPFGSDSDLRRHGEKIASRGGKNAKKRAVVAVARKLAVLLHSLWISAEVYEPLRNTQRSAGGQEA